MAPAIRRRMVARPTDEPHRASSPLELLFDLTFVAAVASATGQLAHRIAERDGGPAIVPFLLVFFAIWWAWMNFTWFASSYDCDDLPYRLLTLLQMAGVLVLAAGVPAAGDGDFRAITVGYLIMRTGLVAQWIRAGVEDAKGRRTALRYAAGIGVMEVCWSARLWFAETTDASDGVLLAIFVALAVVELAVPFWAERVRSTSWHPHHIAERYGLFAIILLGEGVLSASRGVQAALGDEGLSLRLVVLAGAGLALVFSLWWMYFLRPAGPGLAEHRERSYPWGYGHYGVFAALAALGAGLESAVDATGAADHASALAVGNAVAIPVAAFLLLTWAVHAPIVGGTLRDGLVVAGAAAVTLLVPPAAAGLGVAWVVAAIAVVCAVTVASLGRIDHRADALRGP